MTACAYGDAINGPRAIHMVKNDERGCDPVRLDL
jgi:hypothetical protein